MIADLARMERVLARQQGLLDRWVEIGGPGLAGQVRSQLLSLDIPEEDLALPTSQLSGGQRKLVALAACLITQPGPPAAGRARDAPGRRPPRAARGADRRASRAAWSGLARPLPAGRHGRPDRRARQRARSRCGRATTRRSPCAKQIALQRQQQLYVTQQKEIARLEEAIARFKLWASIVVDERHIKQARNKQRQIDRMDKIDRPVLRAAQDRAGDALRRNAAGRRSWSCATSPWRSTTSRCCWTWT